MGQDIINQYRAEIERLNNEYAKAFERLKSQQQEITLLEEENAQLYIFKRKLEDELIENGWAKYVDNKVLVLSEAVEQTRKETAKEILTKIFNNDNFISEEGCDSCGSWNSRHYEIDVKEAREIAEEYGVEVE